MKTKIPKMKTGKEAIKPSHWRIGKSLAESIDELKDRIKKKKASMMLIDGQVGCGKTTLAVSAAEYYQGEPLDFDKQLAMGFDQFVTKLNWCVENGKGVIVYDESGDADKRGAMSKLNRFLNRIFDTFRAFKILIIMVLPNFAVLDSQIFLKAIPRVLAHIDYRDEKKGEYRLFGLYGMMWLKYHMEKLVVPFDAYRKVQTNYSGSFYDLEPERSAELDKLSTDSKKEILKEFAADVNEVKEKKLQVVQQKSEQELLREKSKSLAEKAVKEMNHRILLEDLHKRNMDAAIRRASRTIS